MKGDYLWDGTGEPDPEVEQLERLLGRYRHRGDEDRPPRSQLRLLRAAGVAAALAAGVLFYSILVPRDGYRVSNNEGDVRYARAGDVLEVGASGANVEVAEIGEVEFSPGSLVRIEDTGDNVHAFFMERGSLHASIIAEPRVFQVGTPSGITIDLGCEYQLAVTEEGGSRLTVILGQVAFGYEGREVYVPAGASCESALARGPTPPIFDDASDELRELVEKLAATGAYAEFPTKLPYDEGLLERLLAFEEREDALPLFAMMTDPGLPAGMRAAIFDRLAEVFDRPPTVTREGILAGDAAMRQDWLDVIEHWWR